MSYFDPNKKSVLIVDASPVGVGALLTQDGKVNAYASRALSDVEKRYSQTEREGLAIVWAIEHFHLYLYGHRFVLVTDHLPLQFIFNNPKSKPPARIQRWRLRLQSYDFEVQHKSGKSNAADYISRHPTMDTTDDQSVIAEEYVRYISQNAVPKAMTITELACATKKDKSLQMVKNAIRNNNWENSYEDKMVDTLSRLKHELTIVSVEDGDIILHDNRIVIPKALQERVIMLAHEGHQGIVRTKQLLREKVYFPGIDKRVEDMCKSCIPCLATTPTKSTEPLNMSKLPNAPWSYLSIDFCGPFPSGHYLMVVLDEFSRYPIVETLTTISARAVIPLLDKIFSVFGIPEIVKTDNGSPWQSQDFSNFATHMGFKHRKITPLWPQSNAECERFMKSIGKAIRAAHSENKNWKQEMYNFLRNYRATKHATTDISPATLMFGRKIKTKLPSFPLKMKNTRLRKVDRLNKNKMKDYADNRRNAKPSDLKIGDTVLVRQEKRNKLSTPFNPNPYTITEKKGSMITAKKDEHEVTRNSSFFKQVKERVEHENEDSDTEIKRPVRNRKAPIHFKDYVMN